MSYCPVMPKVERESWNKCDGKWERLGRNAVFSERLTLNMTQIRVSEHGLGQELPSLRQSMTSVHLQAMSTNRDRLGLFVGQICVRAAASPLAGFPIPCALCLARQRFDRPASQQVSKMSTCSVSGLCIFFVLRGSPARHGTGRLVWSAVVALIRQAWLALSCHRLLQWRPKFLCVEYTGRGLHPAEITLGVNYTGRELNQVAGGEPMTRPLSVRLTNCPADRLSEKCRARTCVARLCPNLIRSVSLWCLGAPGASAQITGQISRRWS